MFTGLITDVGEVVKRDRNTLAIASAYPADAIATGASIACDGCCLTVTRVDRRGQGSLFRVDVSNETLHRTTLGVWTPGRAVNLERSLRVGDELGGHMVLGHVDGVAEIVEITADGDSLRFDVRCGEPLAPYVAEKGSVALDGISLTVNTVEAASFTVNLIPHTLKHTTWGDKSPSDRVNMEVDVLARYVARIGFPSH